MLNRESLKLIYRAWKYRLGPDAGEIDFLLSVVKKGATAFDIGAHKGAYTYWLRKAVGKNGKVVAFEPQQTGARLLNKLFTNSNVVVERIAVSDREDVQQLYIQPQSWDVSFEASLNDRYEGAHIENIHTETLDHYCERTGFKPSFIKIDVEGHELPVIEGAASIIEQIRPVLMVEIEARHIGENALRSLCEKIMRSGYQCSFFSGKKKIPFAEFQVNLHQNEKKLNTTQYSNNFIFESV